MNKGCTSEKMEVYPKMNKLKKKKTINTNSKPSLLGIFWSTNKKLNRAISKALKQPESWKMHKTINCKAINIHCDPLGRANLAQCMSIAMYTNLLYTNVQHILICKMYWEHIAMIRHEGARRNNKFTRPLYWIVSLAQQL